MKIPTELCKAIKLMVNPKAVFKDRAEANQLLRHYNVSHIQHVDTGITFKYGGALCLIPFVYSNNKINMMYKRKLDWDNITAIMAEPKI